MERGRKEKPLKYQGAFGPGNDMDEVAKLLLVIPLVVDLANNAGQVYGLRLALLAV